MKKIDSLLPNKILKKDFIISAPQTLFPYDWDALKSTRCPICLNRLKYAPSKKLYICSGKKHPKKIFTVRREKLFTMTGKEVH